MVLRRNYNKYQMTLVLAIHNGKDIVVGSDSLVKVENTLTNETEDSFDVPKIYPVNQSASLLLAGRFDTGSAPTFMRTYAHFHSQNKKVTAKSLYDSFHEAVSQLLFLHVGDAIEVIIAGFTKSGIPELYCLRKDHMYTRTYKPVSTYYELAGNKAPQERAKELIEEAGITDKTSTSELRAIIKRILKVCIEEFPDKLGGEPVVNVLRHKRRFLFF
jgi:hypothetical protein